MVTMKVARYMYTHL